MGETITLGEMKDVIKEGNLSPSDLFGVEALTADPLVKGFVDSSLKELKGKLKGEFEARKRVEGEHETTETETDKEKKALVEENKKLKIETAKIMSKDLFSTKSKERKLDDKQNQFIESKQADFVPEDPEQLDKEVDKFMDEKIEEYKKTAEIFGVKVEVPEGEEKKETPGSPPGNETEAEGDASHIPD